MKQKLFWILLIGVPVWSALIIGSIDKGDALGTAKVEKIVSCSKRGCIASVSLNNQSFYADIYQSEINIETCHLSKHSGLGKLLQSEYSCRK